jgi:hypothetical protein
MPGPLHRNSFRRAVRLPCQVVRERDFKLIADTALDLSTEGMLVTTRRRVLTGETVIVSFRSMRLGRWFDAEASVARVVHGRRSSDPGHALGLAFHGTTPDFTDGLFQHLRRLPPTRPARTRAVLAAPLFEATSGDLAVNVAARA